MVLGTVKVYLNKTRLSENHKATKFDGSNYQTYTPGMFNGNMMEI